MMKRLLFFLVLSLNFVASCSKTGVGEESGETQDQPSLTLNTDIEDIADIGTEGRTTKISFTASEAWTAEAVNTRADSWCTVSPTSGPAGICEISISVSANETPYDRYASIHYNGPKLF